MHLIPAIDIRGGRCVRLFQGDFGRETRYDADPVTLAAHYGELGAAWLHIVDLDGASAGAPVNLDLICRMAESAGTAIQLGGGIREQANLQAALEVADRVVLGSLAVMDVERVKSWMSDYGPERITLGFDVRIGANGVAFVTTHGWTRDSGRELADAIEAYRENGLRHVLCTDVARDGALSGPNVELYSQLVERWPEIQFQASGGIRNTADLEALARTGVAGAISGKALLEGQISPQEIEAFLRGA